MKAIIEVKEDNAVSVKLGDSAAVVYSGCRCNIMRSVSDDISGFLHNNLNGACSGSCCKEGCNG